MTPVTRDEWMDAAEAVIHDLLSIASQLEKYPGDHWVGREHERIWARALQVLAARPRRSKRHSITRKIPPST